MLPGSLGDKMPEVSIVLLALNAGENFKKVLSGIFSQSFKSFEVIIIDSGSTDNTLEIANKYPIKIKKIKKQDFGHGKTRNLGAKLAKGKYVVYLTHDAIPENKNWLQELIKPLKEDKKIAGVFSRQVPKENENEIDKFFYFSLYPNENKSWNKDNYSQGDNIFSDVSSAIKKDLLMKYPFDNDIIVTEDYEWASKILKKDFKIFYNSKSKVIHSHSYNLKTLFKRCFDIGVSYQKIYDSNNSKNKNSFIRKGLSIHKNELKYLIKNKSPYLIPYAILKDATKFIAVNLGKNSNLLPNAINKRFSNYRGYWK